MQPITEAENARNPRKKNNISELVNGKKNDSGILNLNEKNNCPSLFLKTKCGKLIVF